MMPTVVPFASDYEIVAIGAGFLTRTLPRSEWSHAAHFAAALWLLACNPEIDTLREMPAMIRAYNDATGVANSDSSGYHQTISHASIRAARSFLSERLGKPLFQIGNEMMASSFGRSDWLLTYWSRERLFSVEARRTWVEPDIRPFPY